MSAAELDVRDVTLTYGRATSQHALRDVSVEVRQGEFMAVTGPSGSGKSSLLTVMGGLRRPNSGSVHHRDRLVTFDRSADRSRAVSIGFVFQAFHLVPHLPAIENVMLGELYARVPVRIRREHALRAMEEVGIAHKAMQASNSLSGGEQQRVAIARAIAKGPLLLLADEPTGNLDRSNGEAIIELLKRINDGGTSVVVVTHDSSVASAAHRVVRIEDGRVVSDDRAA